MDYLLIEHKDRCGECRLIVFDERAVCGYNDRSVEIDSKPDWCPLRPLPEKMDKPRKDKGNYERGYWFGWNACLDAITGKEENV